MAKRSIPRRKGLGDMAVCPVIDFTGRGLSHREHSFEAWVPKEALPEVVTYHDDPRPGWHRVGLIDLDIDTDRKIVSVALIRIRPGLRRCGIGTKLYEKALKLSCERGMKLRSDRQRSAYSNSFWLKQQTKGRAVCERKSKPPEGFQVSPGDVVFGRSGCDRFAIKKPCEVPDLRGARRR